MHNAILNILVVALSLSSRFVAAHGNHGSNSYNTPEEYREGIPPEFEGSWQRWHMFHEHGLDDFTPDVVFKLHALSESPEFITKKDILRMYGLQRDEVVGQGDGMGGHDDSELISQELKDKVISKVFGLIDKNHDGLIDLSEWLEYSTGGGELPDFGLGPGHEYDFEEEYEKHHWLKYHSVDDPDVTVMHKEDVEHELLHHFHEIDHDDEDIHENPNGVKYNVRKPILVKNIPPSFQY